MAADYARLAEQVRDVQEGGADLLHFDIMDGNFVPNLTFGPELVKALRPHTDLPFDAHLMVLRPEQYFSPLAEAGVSMLSFHLEAVSFPHRTIRAIRELGMRAGVAISPAVPIHLLEPLLSELDFVLVMGVEPGFHGQKLIPLTLKKLKELKEKVEEQGLRVEIEFDGGVTEENLPEVVSAGADIVVGGASVFCGRFPPREMMVNLKRLARK